MEARWSDIETARITRCIEYDLNQLTEMIYLVSPPSEISCEMFFYSVELLVSVHPGFEGSVVGVVLDSDAIGGQMKRLAHAVVNFAGPTSEAPFARDDQLLTTRELEFGSPEGLDDVGLVCIFATHAHHSLADVHTRHQSLGLAKSSSHSSLEPISSGAR